MLKTIGVQSIEDLFSDIPPALRFKGDMNLPAALSESEVAKLLRELAGKNTAQDFSTFIRAVAYDH
ncbi:MAG: hypothetical protein GX863_08470 [Firmicutes bacterium]|nr:hypothetical protein [Candidatus Fermentithermobacillaceae bacterium]